MTVHSLIDEIMHGAHVEVVLAKHLGLSLTRKDVQAVKKALKNKDDRQMEMTINFLMQKRTKRQIAM